MARKASESESYRQYIIPYNFADESTMFGGMFRTRNFIEGAVLAAIFAGPVLMFPVGLTAKACLLIVFGMPPLVFGNIGLNNDALTTFFRYFLKYRKNKRKVYYNSRVKVHSAIDIEEGLRAELPRDKVLKMFDPIINKKSEKENEDECNEEFVFDDDIDNTVRKRKEKNKKEDYSSDIVYEGELIEDILEYTEDLDELEIEAYEDNDYEDIIWEDDNEGQGMENPDLDILNELSKISSNETEIAYLEDEVVIEDNAVQTTPEEFIEIVDSYEILEILEDVEKETAADDINKSNSVDFTTQEPNNEEHGGENELVEEEPIVSEEKPVENENKSQEQESAINIFDLAAKKAMRTTDPQEEIDSNEKSVQPQAEDPDPGIEVESEEDGAEEISEDTDEGDAEVNQEKKKRRRKRRRNKKASAEGGESIAE